jgi:diketogulonate reductase-like aldo/keto reductase
MSSIIPTVVLQGGKQVPIIAFGVGTALFKADCTKSIQQACHSGFTFIDTAEAYQNSQYVGTGLEEFVAKKQQFTIVAKLMNMKEIHKSALEEREKLKVKKLDLLLLHSPPRAMEGNPSNVEAWKIMEQLKDEGVADVIGVSNWLVSDIQEVLSSKPKHPIEVNQIEYHPLIASSPQYKELMQIQKQERITVMTYASLAPLTKVSSQSTPLHKTLKEIADKESDWTLGTVLQKWASQSAKTHTDAIIISTSNKTDRLKEYMSTFTSRKLTAEEVDKITEAGQKEEQSKFYMEKYFH